MITVLGYLVIIFFGVAGVITYATAHGYQTMHEVWADLPDMATAIMLFLSVLVAVGCVLVWEWYRRASRGE